MSRGKAQMQHDMFEPDEDLEMKWEVIEVRYKKKEISANSFENFPIYVHTRPKNWNPPKHHSDEPPWDENE